ncbi:hypothetical protein RKE29_17145 [Streptomyces sp. B1866]|uniref:hypothetical protein n=1 Tax=Streptomyces sp. B1866 TaxID=3075431 RepID=UPI00288D01A6|nr:hypothetical protein [Streptomyces sp. B1866]MDT3398351.1 hypothetical protein [Streptomyces sp. B1866]
MSASKLALFLAAGTAAAVGTAALRTAWGLRHEIAGLRSELADAAQTADAATSAAHGCADGRAESLPAPRAGAAPAAEARGGEPRTGETRSGEGRVTEVRIAEIRAAVADALAEERERELAEARAFWAAQEARDATGASAASDAHSLLGGLPAPGEDTPLDVPFEGLPYVPCQPDLGGVEPALGTSPATAAGDAVREAGRESATAHEAVRDAVDARESAEARQPTDSPAPGASPAHARAADPDARAESETRPEPDPALAADAEATDAAALAAARRRHPSHPDFHPAPAVADQERTVTRLTRLADARTPLTDVRPGPLGTLDVYVFSDGTTVCMTPGHQETADRLAAALRTGTAPVVLLGGSGVSGGFALTFGCGDESVYVLADRVIASL